MESATSETTHLVNTTTNFKNISTIVPTSNYFISSNTAFKTFSSLFSALPMSSTNLKTSTKPSLSVETHPTSTFITMGTSIKITSILRYSSTTQSYMISGYSITKGNTVFSEFGTSTNSGNFAASVFPSNNTISSNNTNIKTSSFSLALPRSTTSSYWYTANIRTSIKSSVSVRTQTASAFITIITSLHPAVSKLPSNNQNKKTTVTSYLQTLTKTKEKTMTMSGNRSRSMGNFKASMFSSINAIPNNTANSKISSLSSALPLFSSFNMSSTNTKSSLESTITSLQMTASKYPSNMQSKETSKHPPVSSYLQSSMITKKSSANSELKRLTSTGNLKTTVFSSNKVILRNASSRRTPSFPSVLPMLTSSYWSNANIRSSVKSSVSEATRKTSSFIPTITSLQAVISKYSSNIQSKEISKHSPMSSYLQSSMTMEESSVTSGFKGSNSVRNCKTCTFLSNIVTASNVLRSKTSSSSSVLPSFTLSYWSNANIRSSIKSTASVETKSISLFITTITSLWTAILKYSSNIQSKESSRYSSMSSYLQSSAITKENSTNSVFRRSTSIENIKTNVFSSNKIISSNTVNSPTSSFSSVLPRLTSSYWSNVNIRSSIKSSVSVATHLTSSFITTIASLQTIISKYASNIQSKEILSHSPMSLYLHSSMITRKNSTTSEFKGSTSIRNRKTSAFLSNIVISSNAVVSNTSPSSSFLPSFTLSYWSNANIRSSINSFASVETQAAITTVTSLWTTVSKYSTNMENKGTSRHSPMSSYLQSSMITNENSTNSAFRKSTSIGNVKTNVFSSNKIISSYTASSQTTSFSSDLSRLTSSYWSNANITSSIKSSVSEVAYANSEVITTITSLQAALSKYSRNMESREASLISPVSSWLHSTMMVKGNKTTLRLKRSTSIASLKTSVFLFKNVTSSNTANSKTSSFFSVLPLFTSSYWPNANIRSSIQSSVSKGANTTSSLITFSSKTISTSFPLTESRYSSIIETSKYSLFTSHLDSSLTWKKNTTIFEYRRSVSIRNFETSVLASNNFNASNTKTRKTLSLSSLSPSFTSASRSFTNIKSSIKQFGSEVTHVRATFVTTGTSISTAKLKHYSNMQSKKTLAYFRVASYLHTSKEKKEKTTAYEFKGSNTVWGFKTSILESNNFISNNTASNKVKDKSSIKFTYKMSYILSTIPKNLTIKIKSSLSSFTRRSGEIMMTASNQTILKTISHSTAPLINNVTSYYDTSLSHIGASSLSLKKFTSITTTGHTMHHSRSLEATVIGKNFSIVSKYSFLNMPSVTPTVKSILHTSILDKVPYATRKLETSIFSSVGLIKMSSQTFITSSSYNSALSSRGKTNTRLLETVSIDSFYQKSMTGLWKSSSNLIFSSTVGNHFSTDKLLYSSSQFSSQPCHYSNHSLLRTSTYYFTSSVENFAKYTSVIIVSLKRTSSRLATSLSKFTSIPVINSVSTKIKPIVFSSSMTISRQTVTASYGSRSSPMTVAEQSLLSSYMLGSSTSKLTHAVSAILVTKKLASVFIESSSTNFLSSATIFSSVMLSPSKQVSTISYIVLSSNILINTYSVIVPSSITTTKINLKTNFEKSTRVDNSFKQSFATLSVANTDINRTVEKTEILSKGYTSLITNPTTVSTIAQILLTTTLIQANISSEISPTASLSLQATSSVISTTPCVMQCVIKVIKTVKPNVTEDYIKKVLIKEFESFRIPEYLNILFQGFGESDTNSKEFFFNLLFQSEICTGKLKDTVFSKARIFNDKVKFGKIFLSDSFDIKPFKPAKEDEIKFKAKIRLVSEPFDEDLKYKSSKKFKQLEKAVREALTFLYQKLKGFVGVVNISFEAGSVITNYEIIIDKKEAKTKNEKSIEYNIVKITLDKLNTGKLGNFTVDKSFSITLSESVSPKKEVKVPGWAIALMVIVILVIIAFIVVAIQKVSFFYSIKILLAVNCSLGQNPRH